jgi:hypothetical protein
VEKGYVLIFVGSNLQKCKNNQNTSTVMQLKITGNTTKKPDEIGLFCGYIYFAQPLWWEMVGLLLSCLFFSLVAACDNSKVSANPRTKNVPPAHFLNVLSNPPSLF